MKKFQVITDSTSDLIKKDRDTYQIDYAKMGFNFGEENFDADLDWKGITAHDFYTRMRDGKKRPITSLVSGKEFENVFIKYLQQGLDIIYISCSSKLSGSINNAEIIVNELKEQYPDRRIVCVDSLRSNYSQGLIALEAGKMALDGKDLDETVAFIEKNRLSYQTIATVGTLDWLKKSGRVTATTAFFGNLIGVKPLILSDAHGNNYAFKKEKGRMNSLNAAINYVIENVNELTDIIKVEHADSEKDAQYVADKIHEALPNIPVEISPMGPIIGASVGPDTITISFRGKEVTIFQA
jgi:DegV family protein with EDD domain